MYRYCFRNEGITMSESALLDEQRSVLFKNKVNLIENFARKRYGHLSFFEEITQTLLLEYAIALSKADLEDNYEAYCWRAMRWAGNVFLNKTINKDKMTASNVDLENNFHNDATASQIDTCTANIKQCMLIEKLRVAYNRLSKDEQFVVAAEFDTGFGLKSSVNNYSYDKRKRIARKFKNSVLSANSEF